MDDGDFDDEELNINTSKIANNKKRNWLEYLCENNSIKYVEIVIESKSSKKMNGV